MNLRITLAALAVATFALSAPAEARRHHLQNGPELYRSYANKPASQFCGDRYCSGTEQRASRPARTVRARSHAGRQRVARTTSTYRADDEDSRHQRPSAAVSGGGIVRSAKTGATARVAPQYSHLFQGYVDALEAAGATVRFLGGIRRGHCWSGGMHPCGKALDICQLSRDRVDARCHLPGRETMARIAAAHGLFEGGQWCHGDMGHAQVGVSAAACGTTLMARSHRHHRHHRRYASR